MLFRSVFVKWNFDTTEKISPGIAGLPAVLRGKLFFSYFLAAGLVTAGSHGIPGEIFSGFLANSAFLAVDGLRSLAGSLATRLLLL